MNNRSSIVVAKGSSIFFSYTIDYKLKEIIGEGSTAKVKVFDGATMAYEKDAEVTNTSIVVRLTKTDNIAFIDKLIRVKVYVMNNNTGLDYLIYDEKYSFTK